MRAGELYSTGCEAYSEGRYEEAEKYFRACDSICPDQPDILNALGSALEVQGRLDEALDCLQRACNARPDNAEFRYNLGNLLRKRGERDAARSAYEQAVSAKPELADAWYALGHINLEDGDEAKAEKCLLRAIDILPSMPAALYDLGQLSLKQGRLDEAEGLFRKSIEAGDFVPAVNGLGMLLLKQNRVEEAKACLEKAAEMDPAYLPARCNLAVLATWSGNPEYAADELRKAISKAPDDGDLHFNLALALLTAGHLREGWLEYEWRFKKGNPVPLRHQDLSRWTGQPLRGKKLLLHSEQGYGDSLQFIRFASILSDSGATVLLEGQDDLITPILATAPGVTEAFAREERCPAADFQLPMMSLPAVLGKQGWPPPLPPYIFPAPELKELWKKRLQELSGLKVGLAWAGRPEHDNNANRSILPADLAALREIAGVSWVSLQFGVGNVADVPLTLNDFSDEVKDFSDSAALVSNLDLVVTIDSAVAHLAGAIDVPVLLLLPWNADWRWQQDCDETPWYPKMKLFRQTVPGEWSGPISAVAERLRAACSIESCLESERQKRSLKEGIFMPRDFSRLNRFLDKIEADVYPEEPSYTHELITEKALEQMEKLYPLQPGMKVLDVGCGQGPALEYFRLRGADYLGVTLSDEDIKVCISKGFNAVKMDQSFLNIPEQSQDLIWARHVIEHSVFPLFTLHGFNQVLRAGGMLYLEVPAPGTSCHHELNPNHYSVLPKEAWRSLLLRSGLRVLGDVDYSFEVPAGPDTYWGFYCIKQSEI